jgi:hypothetical protein
MSIVLVGSTSGSITLQEPAVAGTTVLTLPATSGTVSLDGPAFSAYLSSSQTVSGNTWTKLQANTEEFDTASCYDSSTNYRFTPNVAGYYQINGGIAFADSSTALTACVVAIYKNGSSAKWGTYITRASNNQDMDGVVSALIYLNGSTDYVELYGYVNGTGTLTFTTAVSGQQRDYFQASLVRAA